MQITVATILAFRSACAVDPTTQTAQVCAVAMEARTSVGAQTIALDDLIPFEPWENINSRFSGVPSTCKNVPFNVVFSHTTYVRCMRLQGTGL